MYGDNCTQQCTGHCKDGAACNHVTGLCDGGCDAGWTGYMCDKGTRTRIETQQSLFPVFFLYFHTHSNHECELSGTLSLYI